MLGALLEIVNTALVVFGYNRPGHLKMCLDSLQKNRRVNDIKVHIFIDGPRDKLSQKIHEDVVSTALKFQNSHSNCEIFISEENLGLRASVISGLSKLFKSYKALIVVEDDLILHEGFVDYMVNCINLFAEDKLIGSISGFKESNFPFFIDKNLIAAKRHSCWGWATWADRWNLIVWNELDFDSKIFSQDVSNLRSIGWDLANILKAQKSGSISSWAITFDSFAARNGWRAIHPRFSMVQNFGMDGSGTHFTSNLNFNKNQIINNSKESFEINGYTVSKVYDFWLRVKKSWMSQQFRKISYVFRYLLKFLK